MYTYFILDKLSVVYVSYTFTIMKKSLKDLYSPLETQKLKIQNIEDNWSHFALPGSRPNKYEKFNQSKYRPDQLPGRRRLWSIVFDILNF